MLTRSSRGLVVLAVIAGLAASSLLNDIVHTPLFWLYGPRGCEEWWLWAPQRNSNRAGNCCVLFRTDDDGYEMAARLSLLWFVGDKIIPLKFFIWNIWEGEKLSEWISRVCQFFAFENCFSSRITKMTISTSIVNNVNKHKTCFLIALSSYFLEWQSRAPSINQKKRLLQLKVLCKIVQYQQHQMTIHEIEILNSPNDTKK